MEKYEIRFYLLTLASIIFTLMLIKSIIKTYKKEKGRRKPLFLFTFYIFTALISVGFYSFTSYISWRIPEMFSYEEQCLIYAIVFCANSLSNIIMGEFIYDIFILKGTSKGRLFRIFYICSGILSFIIFLTGGIFGYTHEPLPPPPINNNDIKIEFYALYNLILLPILVIGFININKLIKKVGYHDFIHSPMRYIALFFLLNALVFLFGLLDAVNEIFGHIVIIILLLAGYCAYKGFLITGKK